MMGIKIEWRSVRVKVKLGVKPRVRVRANGMARVRVRVRGFTLRPRVVSNHTEL